MEKHKLANLIKNYAIINGVCWGVLFFFMLAEFNFFVSVLALAAGILVSVGMYTIGEVVQLLYEIKLNTAKSTGNAQAANRKDIISSALPKL